MKKSFSIYISIVSLSFLFASCFKVDEKLADKKAPAGDILFQVPDAALPAAPTGQPQLEQPTFYLVSANFYKTATASPAVHLNVIDITIQVPPQFSKITINLVNTNTGLRELKDQLTDISTNTQWNSFPVSKIGFGNSVPANGTYVLEFVASNADGSVSTSRFFSIVVGS